MKKRVLLAGLFCALLCSNGDAWGQDNLHKNQIYLKSDFNQTILVNSTSVRDTLGEENVIESIGVLDTGEKSVIVLHKILHRMKECLEIILNEKSTDEKKKELGIEYPYHRLDAAQLFFTLSFEGRYLFNKAFV